jgi:hypothetical protein
MKIRLYRDKYLRVRGFMTGRQVHLRITDNPRESVADYLKNRQLNGWDASEDCYLWRWTLVVNNWVWQGRDHVRSLKGLLK